MDLQFWIWLIAIVAMFVARAMRKSPQAPQPTGEQRNDSDDDESSGNKPMTFEELLREIQQSKTPPRPEVKREVSSPFGRRLISRPTPPAKSYEVDYDDDIPDEEQDLETIPVQREERASEAYEQAKRDAFQQKSLEETMKLADTEMKFTHFKGYDDAPKQPTMAHNILREFSDPEGFKKAFIMSEILKRKF
jgi:hypothetical protein